MSLFAETNGYVEYDDRSHKRLSDNRALYIAQSAMTVNGRVPTVAEVRAHQSPRALTTPEPAPDGPPKSGTYTHTPGA